MRRSIAKISVLVLFAVSSTWPMLIGGAVAGRTGMQVGFLTYIGLGGMLIMVLAFACLRGILSR